MVVVFGVDVHKKSHTVVAVDQAGRQLGVLTVPATSAGHGKALAWSRTRFADGERRWGVEDCRAYSMRLERDLLAAGQPVVRVPPKLMALCRASARTRGKSDPIDALAVARAVLREPGLPVAVHDEASRELRLLSDHRDHLVAERTRWINRLRGHLHELDPGREPARLDGPKTQAGLGIWLASQIGPVADLAAELLREVARLTARVNQLEHQIADLVTDHPLQSVLGCGPLTTAKIIAETAGISRFGSEACYARHTGVAPIPVWSGQTAGRVRLCRSGNRQLNCALHRIALTQISRPGSPGQIYYQHRRQTGDSAKAALRSLKRHLNRVVYRTLTRAEQAAPATSPPRLTNPGAA